MLKQMQRSVRLGALCTMLGMGISAHAAGHDGHHAAAGQVAPAAGQVVAVGEPWVRATVPQQRATGAFMVLTAGGQGARLVGAESPVAGAVEVHEMTMVDQVMRMRQVAGVDLPAGHAVALKPGGYHIMLMGLKQQVREGDEVPLTLHVETPDGQRHGIALQVPVRALTEAAHGGHGAAGHDHGKMGGH